MPCYGMAIDVLDAVNARLQGKLEQQQAEQAAREAAALQREEEKRTGNFADLEALQSFFEATGGTEHEWKYEWLWDTAAPLYSLATYEEEAAAPRPTKYSNPLVRWSHAWPGVRYEARPSSCSGGRVVELVLRGVGLAGDVTPPRTKWPELLQDLDLRNNPGLQADLSQMLWPSHLVTLNLRGCKAVRGEFSALRMRLPPTLQMLDVSSTATSGKLPVTESLGHRWPRLQGLYLQDTSVEGVVEDVPGWPEGLVVLDLSRTRIVGSLALSQLPKGLVANVGISGTDIAVGVDTSKDVAAGESAVEVDEHDIGHHEDLNKNEEERQREGGDEPQDMAEDTTAL